MERIEEGNLFMICAALNEAACTELPEGYHLRTLREDELPLWMAFPFDAARDADANRGFMQRYFQDVYVERHDDFFERCMVVANGNDVPVATLFHWRAYGNLTTLHWFKVNREIEGRGIGRALLSAIMRSIPNDQYPVMLHTHPGSCRAIKLYSDFGFALVVDPLLGERENHLRDSLQYLKENMPERDFRTLKMSRAPAWCLSAIASAQIDEF